MIHQKLARFFSCDIGIDLGTANCLVYVRDKDKATIFSEPSVVALEKGTNRVVAVGSDAKKMLGRVPMNLCVVRPMKDGVIADCEVTEQMLKEFIAKAKEYVSPHRRLVKPRVLVAVPSGITPVATRTVLDSVERAGASEVYPIEEPMSSAIGVGLPVKEAVGSMIVDIGGGTTEVAIISLSGIVDSRSVPIGGDEMDQAIVQQMKRQYNLLIGERTAEDIKVRIGSAYQVSEEENEIEIRGRDLHSGLPKNIRISSKEIRACLQDPVTSIVEAVRSILEKCPPELSSDILENGIMLAGGGALLRGLDTLISEEVGIPVLVAEDPLRAVINGTRNVLDNFDDMKTVLGL